MEYQNISTMDALIQNHSSANETLDDILDTFASIETLIHPSTSKPGFLIENLYIDFASLDSWYSTIITHMNSPSFLALLISVLDTLNHSTSNAIAFIISILRNPILLNIESLKSIMPKISRILASLPQSQRINFAWTLQESIINSKCDENAKSHLFRQFIDVFNRFLTMRIISIGQDETLYYDEPVTWAVQSLAILFAINESSNFIPFYEFYNEAVETCMDIKEDYPKWKAKDGFCFINHHFLLSTCTKSDVLRIESMVRMRHELQDAFFRAMFIGVNSPYLQMEIRRDFIIRDALVQLEGRKGHDLKKQLRISFVGEDGIDEGGVQKEFFKVAIEAIFNPEYGLFKMNSDSRLCWFAIDNIKDAQTLEEFRLLGVLVGLAVYNGVVLDIQFPLALYKKLANQIPNLSDLSEIDPLLGKGLQSLLDFEGDVEDVFGRTFEIDLETHIGEHMPFSLKPQGDSIPVTNENRIEFVDLYVQAYFDLIPETAFSSLKEGFDSVLCGSAIEIFRAEELSELICGSPTLDFKELEANTQYDGFDKDTPVIKYFWEVVHEMDEKQKKKLLFFTTGSDRVPVGGLSKLPFILARNGSDSERLPTSHTCYNVLLMGDYSSKEKLKDRLFKALENCDCGFFLN